MEAPKLNDLSVEQLRKALTPAPPPLPRKPPSKALLWVTGIAVAWALLLVLGLMEARRQMNTWTATTPYAKRESESSHPIVQERDQRPLELVSWNVSKRGSFAYIEGQVKNVSSEPLKNVEALGSFFQPQLHHKRLRAHRIQPDPAGPDLAL
jgi:hypothetical protein